MESLSSPRTNAHDRGSTGALRGVCRDPLRVTGNDGPLGLGTLYLSVTEFSAVWAYNPKLRKCCRELLPGEASSMWNRSDGRIGVTPSCDARQNIEASVTIEPHLHPRLRILEGPQDEAPLAFIKRLRRGIIVGVVLRPRHAPATEG